MRGSVKLGRWWIPFRARQVFAPHQGLVWIARVGGVVEGVDGYADGQGAMQWKLLGLIRLLHAQGPDVSHSAAGRVAAEAVWVPTALLPRFGVTWQAADAHHLTASYRLDDVELEVPYTWMTTLGCGRSPSTGGATRRAPGPSAFTASGTS